MQRSVIRELALNADFVGLRSSVQKCILRSRQVRKYGLKRQGVAVALKNFKHKYTNVCFDKELNETDSVVSVRLSAYHYNISQQKF